MDYFARYICRTQLSLSGSPGRPGEIEDSIQVQFPSGEITVYDYYKLVDSEALHHGLVFDAVSKGRIASVRNWVDMIRSIIAFTAKTEVSRPRMKQEFEKEERVRFEQLEFLAEPFQAKDADTSIDVDLFKEINKKLNRKFKQNRNVFKEVNRALKYFTKSLEQETASDRFTMLYIALDALEDPLERYYYSQKPELKHSEEKFPVLEEHFKHVKEAEFEEDIYAARCELFHDADEDKAIERVGKLEKGVQRAILKVLGIDYEDYSEVLQKKPVRNRVDVAMRFTGEINGFDIPDVKPGLEIPRIEVPDIQRTYDWNQESGKFRGYLKLDGERPKPGDFRDRFVSLEQEELEELNFTKGYRR